MSGRHFCIPIILEAAISFGLQAFISIGNEEKYVNGCVSFADKLCYT